MWVSGLMGGPMEYTILDGDLGCNLGTHLGLKTYVVEMSEDLRIYAIEMSY